MIDFAKALQQLRQPDSSQRQLFSSENPATSLSQQLQYLKGRHPVPVTGPGVTELGTLPAGDEEITPHGRHYVVRNVFDGEHSHGKVRLGRFSCDELRQLMSLLREKGNVPIRDRILFLDTETTGMQGGAGMVPFLVGLGYFEGDNFQMVQYFIRDFDEESSMLYALEKLLERFQLVVTYNGSTFDIPLLETRFILARFDNPFAGKAHLDLLIGARRLWRNGHGSCRLVSLEKEIVSFVRGPDVPGAMIPRVYFDYVNHGSSSEMIGVFNHNVYDVVSLAALAVTACDRITQEPARFDNSSDLYSLARIYENTAEWRRSASLYEKALSGDLPEPLRARAAERLVIIYRRLGEYDQALAMCLNLIETSSFSLIAYEGAAIHFERIARDRVRALAVVEEALARLNDVKEPRRWRSTLQTRRERLLQKVMNF